MDYCVFCLGSDLENFTAGGKPYFRCGDCGGIFLSRDFLPSAEDEKKRYELHRNSGDDQGFRTYLERFIDPVLASVARAAGDERVRTVFDYGSGPEPVLVALLREHGFDVRGWDPFFAPDTLPFEGGADLVVCHEVAEHFFEPRRDFDRMAATVKPGGYLAVGTMTLPSDGTDTKSYFSSWWYRQDSTHVAFYTETALKTVGESTGLVWLGAAGKNAFLFRRPDQCRP
jgi:pseudouridine kinase